MSAIAICTLFTTGQNGDPLLGPFCLGYVKGWRRCTALLASLMAVRDLEIPIEDLPGEFKAASNNSFWLSLSNI